MYAEKLSNFLNIEDYKLKLDTFNLNTGEKGTVAKWRMALSEMDLTFFFQTNIAMPNNFGKISYLY